MTLLDLMDAIAVHAVAAAATAGGATLTDVQVGFPVSKGRCIRIFYGGERGPEEFASDKTLNSKLISQAIVVRGYWPTASTATKEHRAIEGQMASFVQSLRARILGDSQLGGKSIDLSMHPATTDQVVISTTQYAVVDIEIVVDADEYAIAP
jgi:hypothetical protein